MAQPRFRLLRIYGTTAHVLASYFWLGVRRPFIGPERYAAALERRHRVNARRIQRTIVGAGGLFIKVGQLISIMSNFLPGEFRSELEGLQDSLPPRPYDEILKRLRAELGADPEKIFASFDPEPVATASLAQVHVAVLHDGRKVAVKAQHADIERVAQEDLHTIGRLLRIVQFFTRVRGLEAYHPEISAMISEELDFAREATNIQRVAEHFVGDPTVRFPHVVRELSSTRVLVTEYIDGTKITDFAELKARGLDRRQLAEWIVGAYCHMIFVDGVYHADPHPGNIFVGRDGAIVFVDFGAVGVLAPQMKQGILAFLGGVIHRDAPRITDAIRTMGFVALDPASADVAGKVIDYAQRRFLEQLSRDSFSLGSLQVDMHKELEALADLRRLDVSFRQLTSTFQVPKDWVLLERTLLLLLGLCTELEPSWNPMTVIRPYLEEVVLGEQRDWGDFLRTELTAWARRAISIPADIERVLERANRGEFQVRVTEIDESVLVVYAGVHQLIYCVLATACGITCYQAFNAGRLLLAEVLGGAAAIALTVMFGSMHGTASRRR